MAKNAGLFYLGIGIRARRCPVPYLPAFFRDQRAGKDQSGLGGFLGVVRRSDDCQSHRHCELPDAPTDYPALCGSQRGLVSGIYLPVRFLFGSVGRAFRVN